MSVGVSGVTYHSVCESGLQSVRNKWYRLFVSLSTCVSWVLCEALPDSCWSSHWTRQHCERGTEKEPQKQGDWRLRRPEWMWAGWAETYECRPWTPPSTWADMVLFSNFSSPEYIIELHITQKTRFIDTEFNFFFFFLKQWLKRPKLFYLRLSFWIVLKSWTWFIK